MNISIVVTAHNEGIIAHYAMQSLFKAIDYANKHGISSETLIILDNANFETEQYFFRYKKNENCKLFQVNFSNIGESKNFGVDNACGEYITFLEAKDLFSENWLAEAFKAVEDSSEKESIIAHPTYEIHFDKTLYIAQSFNSCDLATFALLSGNAFSSVCLAHKKVFLNHRFISEKSKSLDHFWHFSCDTANHIHSIVEKTAVFIREEQKKRLVNDKDKIEYLRNKTLSSSLYNKFPYHNFLKILSIFKYPTRFLRDKRIWYQKYLNFHYFGSQIRKKPKWLIKEIININKTDPTIKSILFKKYDPISCAQENSNFLESFCLAKLLDQYDKETNFCVFMPFLAGGGAEKVAHRYIREMASQPPNRITIFTTEQKLKHSNTYSLPSNINLVHLENILDDFLTVHQQAKLIATLMINFKPSKIYAYNSACFFEALSRYGSEINRYSKVYLNIFALSFMKDTHEMYWVNTDYISKIFPYVTNIITDSRRLINDLTELCGFNEDKFICNYSYIDVHDNIPMFSENFFNVFWASRICREKRLDIFLEIVKKCGDLPITFHIFGSGNRNKYLNKLKKLSNVKYYGSFNGFGNIVSPEFDLFLYTSESDGIPNVLLEAASYGYPAIAPDVGGIGEVVNEKTGFLIKNYLDTDAYVDVLKKLLSDKSILKSKQTNIKELISSKFTKEHFIETMRHIGML